MARLLGLLLAVCAPAALAADARVEAPSVEQAVERWARSPHGLMLERILPPGVTPATIPERGSRGAALHLRYCVQCHHLPSPAMHEPRKWPGIVARMATRMRGQGNLGTLMSEMMAGVAAPSQEEEAALVAYLRRNGQKPIDARAYPDLYTPAGEPFRLACQQCHTLPDPKRYRASEWPAVVARMERNMEWMNRVVGTQPVRGEPQLRVSDINAFLARHARRH